MENASKAIEIAVSAILFIAAIIIAILLYSKMQDVIDMGLYINNTDTVAIYSDEKVSNNLIMEKSEVYYMLKKIVTNSINKDYHIANNNTKVFFNNSGYSITGSLENIYEELLSSSNTNKYEVQYVYKYSIEENENKYILTQIRINNI